MDSFSDLPPVTAPPFSGNPTHPPYSEMIIAAICALNDKDGSSRQAIAKYIERHYSNLPPTHPNLLTHHLKRMKNEGELTMIKHSYALPPPRSVPFQQPSNLDNNHFTDYSVTAVATDNSVVTTPRRKPGRPPKPRHEDFGYQAQPVTHIQPYQPEPQGAYGSEPPIFASLGLADDGVGLQPVGENVGVEGKRGRGRPPKGSVSGSVEGRRPKFVNGGVVKRGRGRPKRIGALVTVPVSGNAARPRGRPKRVQSVSGYGETGSVSRGRGRPPKNKFWNAFGRPSKVVGAGTAVIVTDPKQHVAYQELKAKFQHLQSKAKEVVGVVRPYINPDYEAFGALQDLEMLVEPSL